MIAIDLELSGGLQGDGESLAFALSLTMAQWRGLSTADKWF